MPPRTPGVKVRLAWCRILCFAASARAMFTPASAYFIGGLVVSVSGLGVQDWRVVLSSFETNLLAAARGAAFTVAASTEFS
jgi:hypothetical protein